MVSVRRGTGSGHSGCIAKKHQPQLGGHGRFLGQKKAEPTILLEKKGGREVRRRALLAERLGESGHREQLDMRECLATQQHWVIESKVRERPQEGKGPLRSWATAKGLQPRTCQGRICV